LLLLLPALQLDLRKLAAMAKSSCGRKRMRLEDTVAQHQQEQQQQQAAAQLKQEPGSDQQQGAAAAGGDGVDVKQEQQDQQQQKQGKWLRPLVDPDFCILQ
jgi:hypothetical protein